MGEGLVISERDTTFNLIGRKDPTQVFHCCDTCRLPIVTYGRMIPCKVFLSTSFSVKYNILARILLQLFLPIEKNWWFLCSL